MPREGRLFTEGYSEMKLRAVSGMMLTLLLIGMLTLAFNIKPAKASGTIYITSDYTFTHNVYEPVVVLADNVVVDGNGYTLQGTGSERGIDLSYRSNVSIKNLEILEFWDGIMLENSSNNTISRNNITNNLHGISLQESSNYNTISGNSITNGSRGIVLHSSSNNSIAGNNITNNNYPGIELYSSSNNTVSGNNITESDGGMSLHLSSNYNTISGNSITNNVGGIVLYSSSNNTLRNNNASNNKYNFGVYGSELSHFFQDIDDSNTVNDKPIYYWVTRRDMTVPLDAGYVALVNCTRMTTKNLNLTNNTQGVLLASTTNSTITKNNITNNEHGISLRSSSNNTISGNNITGNGDGILLGRSSNNTINGNNVTNNRNGIRLEVSSSYNTVSENNITANNYYGVWLLSSNNSIIGNNITANGWYGIRLDRSSNNTISGNNITENNGGGIYLYDSSKYNIVSGNNITENNRGIWIDWYSNRNTISGNSITNNTFGIELDESSNNTLRNNDASNNKHGFGVYGTFLSHYIQDIDDSNTVNGKPICYWVNRRDMIVPLDAGYVALVNCTSITIKNLNLTNNVQAVLLASTTNSTITKNNIANNVHGILLCESSSYNTVSENNIAANNYYGVWLLSSNNSIIGNNITANADIGILLWSSSNIIYHNNFVDNRRQVSTFALNVWDNGYPSGGNFWSDYTGADVKSGPYQNEAGSDGIGDTPYVIVGSNRDNYPLTGMFSDFVATSEYHVQTICNSSISDFQFNGTAICFNATGEDDTTGFCRICIPRALMNETYKVFVNGTEVPCNLLPCSNTTHSYLYFSYDLSTQEVIVIPEFPSFLVLPLFMIATLLAVIVLRLLNTISSTKERVAS